MWTKDMIFLNNEDTRHFNYMEEKVIGTSTYYSIVNVIVLLKIF